MPDDADAPRRPADYVRDRRIERVVPLLAPDTLLDELPLSSEQAGVVIEGRREIQAILDGADGRLLAIVGPCSVHDHERQREEARKVGGLTANGSSGGRSELRE